MALEVKLRKVHTWMLAADVANCSRPTLGCRVTSESRLWR